MYLQFSVEGWALHTSLETALLYHFTPSSLLRDPLLRTDAMEGESFCRSSHASCI